MIKEVDYINRKKTIHINIGENQHRTFRSCLFLHGLNMTQFFEACVMKLNENDSSMIKIIEELKEDLKKQKLDRLRNIDRDELYNLIEDNCPQKDES